MIRRENFEAARETMGKIYAYASPEQVDLKVKTLAAAVKQSVEITNTTTLLQRMRLILMDPINRRALSTFSDSVKCAKLTVCVRLSCRLRYASIPAALRLQHSKFLFSRARLSY